MVLGLEIKMAKWFTVIKYIFTCCAILGAEMLMLFDTLYLETYLFAFVSFAACWFAWSVDLYYR